MGDPMLARSSHGTTLRDKFELEKSCRSYAGLPCGAVKNLPNTAASPSNRSQKEPVGNRAMERDEIVRHMSSLPSYLENGKATPDRALNFGVMDWGRLQSWQYRHLKKGPIRRNKCEPSSSNSSPLFSTDGSSPQSSRGQSCSPAHQKPHRVTLQSRFSIDLDKTFPSYVKSSMGNVDKFQDFEEAHCTEKKATDQSETKPKDCKIYDSYPPKLPESESSIDMGNCQTKSLSLKGKTKIQDKAVNGPGNFQHPSDRTRDREHLERHKTVVLLSRNCQGNSETNGKDSVGADHNLSSYALRSELVGKNLHMDSASARNPSTASRMYALEEKRSSVSSKNSDLNMGTDAASKQRSMSPIRRISFCVSSKSAASTTTTKRVESPVPRKSTADNSCVSNRSHSSPLRRLLEPLFPSKAASSRQSTERSHEDSKLKAKAELDLRNRGQVTAESTSTAQALFQTAVKNGRPMFTFAIENNSNILAATVRDLSSGKDNCNSWMYTFFTIGEVKKKKGSLLSRSRKDKDHGYVPNVAAQMKVSNRSISNSDTREFSLFHVDPSRLDCQISNPQPHDELAAIVVKFSGKVDDKEENQETFSTTVILPGGNHGVSSNGKPSPLIERWLSSGVCDCGGWDLGCRLRTLTNQVQSSRKLNSTTAQFELFFQGDDINARRFFSLCPAKEGMFSVEYDSSLSSLQAFSICISVVECRKSSQHTESRMHIAKHDTNAVSFASFPPLSPVGRV